MSGIVVNQFFLWLFVKMLGRGVVNLMLANVMATEIAILNNFTWNDLWTFKDLKGKPLYKRLLNFHLAALTGAVVQWVVFGALVYLGVHYLMANLIGIGFSFVVRFLVNRHVTWG